MRVEKIGEVGRYIKKKDSNISKADMKSKHKHIYKEALIDELKYGIVGIGTYCEICGKIDHLAKPYDLVKEDYGLRYYMLTKEEIRVRYSYLPHFTIENWYKTKFVNIEKENK